MCKKMVNKVLRQLEHITELFSAVIKVRACLYTSYKNLKDMLQEPQTYATRTSNICYKNLKHMLQEPQTYASRTSSIFSLNLCSKSFQNQIKQCLSP